MPAYIPNFEASGLGYGSRHRNHFSYLSQWDQAYGKEELKVKQIPKAFLLFFIFYFFYFMCLFILQNYVDLRAQRSSFPNNNKDAFFVPRIYSIFTNTQDMYDEEFARMKHTIKARRPHAQALG